MAARVARRHFRRVAGIFEAPPKLVKDVTEQVTQVYAEHIWAKAEYEIQERNSAYHWGQKQIRAAIKQGEAEAKVFLQENDAQVFIDAGWHEIDENNGEYTTLAVTAVPIVEREQSGRTTIKWAAVWVTGRRTFGEPTPEIPEMPEYPKLRDEDYVYYPYRSEYSTDEEYERALAEHPGKVKRYEEKQKAQEAWHDLKAQNDWEFELTSYGGWQEFDTPTAAIVAARNSPIRGDSEDYNTGSLTQSDMSAAKVFAEMVKVTHARAQRYLKRAREAMKDKRADEAWMQRIVDLNLTINEAKKYASMPDRKSWTIERTIKVDLTGWKYVDEKLGELESEYVEAAAHNERELEALDRDVRALREDQITRVFEFKNGPRRKPWRFRVERVSKGYMEADRRRGVYLISHNYHGSWTTDDSATLSPERVLRDIHREVPAPLLDEAAKLREYKRGKVLAGQSIKLRIDFEGHRRGWGGWWSPQSREMKIFFYDEKIKLDPASFKEAIWEIRRISRHESQHAGQTMLNHWLELHVSGYKPGLPSRSTWTPSVDPWGAVRRERGKPIVDPETVYEEFGKDEDWEQVHHHHREVEFYTNLADDIDRFEATLRKVPKPYWPAYARVVVGLAEPQPLKDEIAERYGSQKYRFLQGPTTAMPEMNRDSLGWRFRRFKQKNKPKWRKAVKEFYNELRRRGYRLQGGIVPMSLDYVKIEDALKEWRDRFYDKTGVWYTWRDVPGVNLPPKKRVEQGWIYGMFDVTNFDPDELHRGKHVTPDSPKPGRQRIRVLVGPTGKVQKIR